MITKKIHIIGSTGSGKSYLARHLSDKYNIPYYELDNVMWRGTEENTGKNPPETRDALLDGIIQQEAWIVEGVYYKWVMPSFELADIIIFISPPVWKRDCNVILRFIKQRTGLERANYKQSLSGLIDMLRWNHKFEKVHKLAIMEFISSFREKTLIIRSNKDIIQNKI